MADDETFDAIVLGMGPGGQAVASGLLDAGWSVLGVDHGLVGGECANWGCVPTKMMIRAAGLLAEGRRIDGMAGTAAVEAHWAPVAARIRADATSDWDDSEAVEAFEGRGATFARGTGCLDGPGAVRVDGRRYEARRAVVVATGSEAATPPIPGLADVGPWTHRDVVTAQVLPESVIVVGGGAIGCELAQVLCRFGTAVTLVEGADRLLDKETPAAGELIATILAREGVQVLTGASIERVEPDGNGVAAVVDGRRITAERILVATGRRVDLAALGVASVGLDDTDPALQTDDGLRAADGLWAVGDVTGKGAFTHVATYQAGIAVADILGRPHPLPGYRATPRVTFTDPEVGSVGLTPEQAAEAGIPYAVGRADMAKEARGWIHKVGNDGFVELVEDRSRGVLVGATCVGPGAGEVLGLLTVAVRAEVPTSTLRDTMYAYPTFHRAVEAALRDLGLGSQHGLGGSG